MLGCPTGRLWADLVARWTKAAVLAVVTYWKGAVAAVAIKRQIYKEQKGSRPKKVACWIILMVAA